jgi:hypothetical protein
MKARIGLVLWLITMSALGAWLAVMRLDSRPPYEWDATRSVVSPDPAPQAGRVSVEWHMKVNRVCPGSSQRVLTDASTGQTVATYDATPAALSVSVGDQTLNRTFVLPRGLPPRVGYRSTVCFECNALQTLFPLCVTTPTLTFNVEP